MTNDAVDVAINRMVIQAADYTAYLGSIIRNDN